MELAWCTCVEFPRRFPPTHACVERTNTVCDITTSATPLQPRKYGAGVLDHNKLDEPVKLYPTVFGGKPRPSSSRAKRDGAGLPDDDSWPDRIKLAPAEPNPINRVNYLNWIPTKPQTGEPNPINRVNYLNWTPTKPQTRPKSGVVRDGTHYLNCLPTRPQSSRPTAEIPERPRPTSLTKPPQADSKEVLQLRKEIATIRKGIADLPSSQRFKKDPNPAEQSRHGTTTTVRFKAPSPADSTCTIKNHRSKAHTMVMVRGGHISCSCGGEPGCPLRKALKEFK
eukprot:1192656-Prorocentrum_minimum.AAC.1